MLWTPSCRPRLCETPWSGYLSSLLKNLSDGIQVTGCSAAEPQTSADSELQCSDRQQSQRLYVSIKQNGRSIVLERIDPLCEWCVYVVFIDNFSFKWSVIETSHIQNLAPQIANLTLASSTYLHVAAFEIEGMYATIDVFVPRSTVNHMLKIKLSPATSS
jgi:hypothetical protein